MIHVAVLMKPYLELVLAGTKTVECRLTKDARDPFENIERGDVIYFKQSAGPYGAMAVVDLVMCERNLTPKRISELRRDYNHLIHGEPKYWEWKRDAKYCTLIWLKDVQPTDTGPKIRPLQGVAWLTLDEKPKTVTEQPLTASRSNSVRAASRSSKNGSFFVTITEGNLKNNTLYVNAVADRFPPASFGGKTKSQAGELITLILEGGPTVQTDIVGPRNMLRTRVWGAWFRKHNLKPGDGVMFTPRNDRNYTVSPARPVSEGRASQSIRSPATSR